MIPFVHLHVHSQYSILDGMAPVKALVDKAIADVKAGKGGPVPRQLQNKHFDGEDNKNKGQFYLYPHSYPNHYVEQQYLPDALKDAVYYEFGDNKNEQSFKAYWDKIKKR